MKKYKYYVSQPQITDEDKKMLYEALDSGFVSHQGEHVKLFADEFARYHGQRFGVPCNSGTNALYLALKALEVGPGDEVIVPEFTMAATAFAVTYTGATPIFVDCGDDLNINVSLIEEVITPKTKVIMPVHIYGRQCAMDEILKIAKCHNLYVVEDSCEAHGVPPRGDIACFSLFANKIITSGEGGICITDNEKFAHEMRHLANMAFDPDHTFRHPKVGHNFRMTNLQAALALSQLRRMDAILEKRKRIEQWYNERLPQAIQMPSRNVLWMYDVVVDNQEDIRRFLDEQGIETRLFFKPMSMQEPYRGDYEHLRAYEYSRRGFYLPTYTDLTEEDVDYICSKVKAGLERMG
jgi:dTDP-4-amino-4,6-dideoxygalactose transaminase